MSDQEAAQELSRDLFGFFTTTTPRRRAPVVDPWTVKIDGRSYTIARRDSQRQRCYDAEAETFEHGGRKRSVENNELRSHAEVVAFAEHVMESATWGKLVAVYGGCDRVEVLSKRTGSRSDANNMRRRIRIAADDRQRWVVLHELAHVVCPGSVRHHWPWAQAYLKLVSRFLGRATAARLKAAFRKHKVKFSPPRTRNLTETQREALRERGRALAARRKSQLKVQA